MSMLTPYRANDLFSDLRRDMDDAYASWFGRNRALAAQSDAFIAPLDVHENEKDLKVSCVGDVLTIAGERKSEKTESRGAARYTERSFGSFSRSMRLPVHVAHDQIRARYTQGVLEVVVPKAPSAQQREIKVEV